MAIVDRSVKLTIGLLVITIITISSRTKTLKAAKTNAFSPQTAGFNCRNLRIVLVIIIILRTSSKTRSLLLNPVAR